MGLLDGSGVSREVHAPFCEGLRVRFPWSTLLERHEALSDRATVKDRRALAVAAARDKLRAARTGERQ